MKKSISKLFVAILMICNNMIYSQQIATVRDSTNDGTIRFALISGEAKKSTPAESREFLKKVLKAEVGDNFYLYKTQLPRESFAWQPELDFCRLEKETKKEGF